MTAGELAVVLAAVLCSIGFAALIVVLLRVLDSMKIAACRGRRRCARRPAHCWPSCAHRQTTPRSRWLRPATISNGSIACSDRPKRSAAPSPAAVVWRVRRSSTPVIKTAAIATGTDACGSPPAAQGAEVRMIKRMTWFVGGAVAGVAGASVAKKQGEAGGHAPRPRGTSCTARTGRVRDAFGEGRRAMRARETELRARMDGGPRRWPMISTKATRCWSMAVPVEPGQVIVLKQVRDRRSTSAVVAGHDRHPRRRARLRRCRPIASASATTELALYRRDASNLEGHAGVVCFPTTTDEVQACVAHCRSARSAVRRPRRRHWSGRRGDAARRRRPDRDHQDEPGAVGRSGQPPGVGRAGRAEPRPHPGGRVARVALRSRSRAASRAARSAATSPTTPAGRIASPTASRRRTSSASRSCCPTARSCSWAARTASRTATTCAVRSSAARGCAASPPRSACG